MSTTTTLLATDDSPHRIDITRNEHGHVIDLLVDRARVSLTRYAADAFFIATDNIDDAERRRAYWLADIRTTVERLQAGEMDDADDEVSP